MVCNAGLWATSDHVHYSSPTSSFTQFCAIPLLWPSLITHCTTLSPPWPRSPCLQTESPFAALPGQPLSLQPALSNTDQVYLPNRCVTELPVAQRGECWDVVSDVPVEAHAVQGAPKSGRSRQLQADSRTPSLLGRKVALPHPFWACGCLAPRTAEE